MTALRLFTKAGEESPNTPSVRKNVRAKGSREMRPGEMIQGRSRDPLSQESSGQCRGKDRYRGSGASWTNRNIPPLVRVYTASGKGEIVR